MRNVTDLPTARSRSHSGFTRIDARAYHKHPALSRSVLEKIRTSPLHLQHYLVHGADESDAMIEGRVLHALVEAKLKGQDAIMSDRVAVWTGDRRAGKAWDEFCAVNVSRDIVKADAMARIKLMADAVLTDSRTRPLLEGASIEVAAFWKDAPTGVDCRALIDVAHDVTLFDLKSTSAVDLDAFMRSAYNFGYHRQAAWYLDGSTAATGRPYMDFGFIVVEKEAPHAVSVLHYDDAAVAAGRAENRANLNLYAACKEANSWPGPSGGLISLPRWANA